MGDLVRLELEVRTRPAGVGRYAWRAFEPDDRFTRAWWEPHSYSHGPDYVKLAVLSGGVEVARVELDESVDYAHYVGAPYLGSRALEIQLVEVADGCRGRGVGGEVVRMISDMFPERRLVAFNEGADGFWASIGWVCYVHPEGRVKYRPLFIQPDTVW